MFHKSFKNLIGTYYGGQNKWLNSFILGLQGFEFDLKQSAEAGILAYSFFTWHKHVDTLLLTQNRSANFIQRYLFNLHRSWMRDEGTKKPPGQYWRFSWTILEIQLFKVELASLNCIKQKPGEAKLVGTKANKNLCFVICDIGFGLGAPSHFSYLDFNRSNSK